MHDQEVVSVSCSIIDYIEFFSTGSPIKDLRPRTNWVAFIEHPPVAGSESEFVLILSWLCVEFETKIKLAVFLLLVRHFYGLPWRFAHGARNEDGRLQSGVAVVYLVFLCHGWVFGRD